MIEKLVDFSKKSFKNYTTAVKFKNRNLIFGYNGRGKSSLASGIAEMFEQTQGSIEGLSYFNTDYINKNIILEEGQNNIIKGVVATFSEKEVNIEEEIKTLKKKLKDETSLRENIHNLEKEVRLSIDAKHKERKGKLSISIKASNKSVEEVIRLYNKDIEDAKKIQNNEEILIRQQGDDSLEKEISYLESMYIPDFSIDSFSEKELEKIKEILIKRHSNSDIPSSQIVEWLNQGLSFHEHEAKCKFCQNEFNYAEIKKRINVYNEDVKQKNSAYIMRYINVLEKWLNCINSESFNKSKKALISYFSDDEIVEIFRIIVLSITTIDEFNKRLEHKISNMEKIDDESIEKFVSMIKSLNDKKRLIDKLRTDKLKSIRNQNANQSTLVKGAIGLAIKEDYSIQTKLKDLHDARVVLNDTINTNKQINDRILELENKDSDHEDFRKFLNSVLEDLQINMKLIPHENGKNYTLTHSKFTDTPLTIENISEGEKNLLALLFFYYQLFEDDKQEELKNSIKLLIIDDPISSLDDANKFYVLEMLKSILKNSKPSAQVFILTHAWDDFCKLSYGLKTKGDEPYALFEVFKNTKSCSEIREARSNISPYRKLFKEINEFITKDVNFLNDCDIYHTPNSMRRVFEEFLQFKNSTEITPTKSQQVQIEETIIKSTDGKEIDGKKCSGGSYLSGKKRSKLGQLLIITNVLSHSARHDTTEIYQAAKFLMQLIKDMDSAHYHAMLA